MEIVDRSVSIMDAFRQSCRRFDYVEEKRMSLVSAHDATIRFTNSTISVLKPMLSKVVTRRVFLVQPALRLRNLSFWQKHGRMSGFGCYFMAFGALAPPTDLAEVHRQVLAFLIDGLGVLRSRVLMRVSSQDADLMAAVGGLGVTIECDGYEFSRYRHRFGDNFLAGRNSNCALMTERGPVDIANIILIERQGEPIGVEMAFGVNMVLAQIEGLAHPVDASVGAVAARLGVIAPIAQDAIGVATALAIEGLKPVARGRGGNYLDFLRLLSNSAFADEVLFDAALAVATAETEIRRYASPLAAHIAPDLTAGEAAKSVSNAIQKLRG